MAFFLIGLLALILLPIILISSAVKKHNENKAEEEREERRVEMEHTAERMLQEANFSISKKIQSKNILFYVDDINKKWCYCVVSKNDGPHILPYKSINSFELTENGQSVVSSTAGEALMGGLLLGTVGAIAGASSSKNINEKVNSVDIRIFINDLQRPLIILPVLVGEANKGDALYSAVIEKAKEFMATFQYMQKSA